jgi:hypothetical protein
VVSLCTSGLTLKSLVLPPQSEIVCFMWCSQFTKISSLYSIKWLVFIMGTECRDWILIMGTECRDWIFIMGTECRDWIFIMGTECRDWILIMGTECRDWIFFILIGAF